MTQNTAQNEAMQAVRLLYRYAVKHQGAEHEALYQARQLLEGVIEGAEKEHVSQIIVPRNAVIFRQGERVLYLLDYPDLYATIDQFYRHQVLVITSTGARIWLNEDDLKTLNPGGSFK